MVRVSVWLLGCDCLCPVTPQGGVLWHAGGKVPLASIVASSPEPVESHPKMIVRTDRRREHYYVVLHPLTFYKILR